MLYLFCKWLHFIGLISWMAGILYLFRLFVNHRERVSGAEAHALLVGMELRLYRYITTPAMLVTFAAGIGMIVLNPGLFKGAGWLHLKLFLVLCLAGITGYAGGLRRKFEDQQAIAGLPSGRTLRILNEVPTLLMMAIVALAVFRPF